MQRASALLLRTRRRGVDDAWRSFASGEALQGSYATSRQGGTAPGSQHDSQANQGCLPEPASSDSVHLRSSNARQFLPFAASACHGHPQQALLLGRGRKSGLQLCASSGQTGALTPHTAAPSRSFFLVPDPRQLWYELQDPNRRTATALIAINIGMYILTSLNRRLLLALVQNNLLIAKGEWYRLLTAPFLHASILHLLGNQLALHYLAAGIEPVAGRAAFLAIYMAGAVGGSLCQYYYGAWGSTSLGSSGAIAGIFAAYVVYKLRNRAFVGFTAEDQSYIAQMVLLNVLISYMFSGSIAHMAHLGGLIAGGAACWLFGPNYQLDKWGRTVNRPLISLPRL